MQLNRLLPLLALLLLLFAAMIVWLYPPTGDFRTENPFWNGLQTYGQQTGAVAMISLADLPSNEKQTTLILIPYSPFTESELTQIRNYVANGGTLILLDDYGEGNQVLSSLGLNMKFTGQPLIDPLFNYKNKMLPKITDFANTSLSMNVSSIVFNHASTLQAADTTVAAYSSSFSFLDSNNNEAWDEDEPAGSFPVVAYTKLEQGYVVAIADPSILINGMINRDDNIQFLKNTVELQGSYPQIYIDQTHLPNTPLDGAKALLASMYEAAVSPLGTILLVATLFTVTFYPIWKKVKKHESKPNPTRKQP